MERGATDPDPTLSRPRSSRRRLSEVTAADEVVEIATPTLIGRDVFARTQQELADHNQRATPPRVVNGPCLLTGLAVCGTCGSGMTRTGTIRRRKRYSYYTCAGCHQKGSTACRGRHGPWRSSTPWSWAP